MPDDLDVIADREARMATAREPAAEPLTISYFSCRLGRKEPELPTVQVLADFVGRWVGLGWTRGEEQAGKVTLVWRKGGEPVRPGRR